MPTIPVSEAVTKDQIAEIGQEAYIYAFPLLMMELTRRAMTNVEAPDARIMRAPMNQFLHAARFPDADFTDVVRPNADTLYSILWFDVGEEPLIISVPDSGGRYYLLPMLDMWTEVFASPGPRTTGTAAQLLAIAGPSWIGSLPPSVRMYRSPTPKGWMIGRAQANGSQDLKNVGRFQSGLTAAPLSVFGKPYTPPKGVRDQQVSSVPPVKAIEEMPPHEYFSQFARLIAEYPPHPADYPILDRLEQIGIVAGKPFDMAAAAPEIRVGLRNAAAAALPLIKTSWMNGGALVNGWRAGSKPTGVYGTDYLARAGVAYFGLGANVNEDAIYPSTDRDAEGNPLNSGSKYVIRFLPGRLPPVQAFWSLTLYDERQLFAHNPIQRYSIGDRDKVTFSGDGGLTVYLQRESPGGDKESNWLPTPQEGDFSLTLRLYWPRSEALSGQWTPPPVERLG